MLIRMGMGGQLSGSVGGVVAARNAGGMYLRNRTVPVNPNSVRQQAARAAFASVAIGWRSLTAPQRSGWDSYAVQTPVLNRLGESITISGLAHYVRTNAFRLNAGEAVLSTAPLIPGLSSLGEVASVSLSVADGVGFITVDATATGPAIAQIGPPVSQGVSFFKGPFSLGARATMNDVGFLTAAVTVPGFRWGPIGLFQRRFVRIASSDPQGRLSNSVILVATVEA